MNNRVLPDPQSPRQPAGDSEGVPREYDPIIGRWTCTDPAAQFYSPYLAMGNNPIVSVDPNGEFIGTIIGGLIGAGVAAWQGENVWKGAVSGAVAGAVFDVIVASGGTAIPVLIAAGAAAGAAGNLVDQGWDAAAGNRDSFDGGGFVASTVVGGVLGPAGKLVGNAGRRLLGRVFPGLLRKSNISVGPLMSPSQAEQLLFKGADVIHKHHVFSQKFRDWFVQRGIANIDDYTVQVSQQTHLRGVHGSGLGNLPGRWNKLWESFITKNPNATPAEIFHHGEGLLKRFGLEHLPYGKY